MLFILFLPLLLLEPPHAGGTAVAAASSGAACTSALDCHLNGDCTNGVCACVPQWSGAPDCGIMSFANVNKTAQPGYHNTPLEQEQKQRAAVTGCAPAGRWHNGLQMMWGLNTTRAVTLAWMLAYDDDRDDSGSKNLMQTSYEVETFIMNRVDNKGRRTEWKSGRIGSNEQRVEALPLAILPGERVEWRVRATLSNGAVTPWSGANRFESEPTSPFQGLKWLGGGGQMRLTAGFIAPSDMEKATLRVSGVGAFYAFINGKRVGQNFMDPPQSVYSRTVYYQTFDVTDMLIAGTTNNVGALLGNYKFGYDGEHHLCVCACFCVSLAEVWLTVLPSPYT